MRTTLVLALAILAQWGIQQMLSRKRGHSQQGPPPRTGIWPIHPRSVYSSLYRTPRTSAGRWSSATCASVGYGRLSSTLLHYRSGPPESRQSNPEISWTGLRCWGCRSRRSAGDDAIDLLQGGEDVLGDVVVVLVDPAEEVQGSIVFQRNLEVEGGSNTASKIASAVC